MARPGHRCATGLSPGSDPRAHPICRCRLEPRLRSLVAVPASTPPYSLKVVHRSLLYWPRYSPVLPWPRSLRPSPDVSVFPTPPSGRREGGVGKTGTRLPARTSARRCAGPGKDYADLASLYVHRLAGVSCTYPVQPGKQDSEQGTEQEIGAAPRVKAGSFYTCKDVEDVALTGSRRGRVEPWNDVDGPARELLAAVMAWVSGFERRAPHRARPRRSGSGRAPRQGSGAPARPSCSCGRLRGWWRPVRRSLRRRGRRASAGRRSTATCPKTPARRGRERRLLSRADPPAARVSDNIRF